MAYGGERWGWRFSTVEYALAAATAALLSALLATRFQARSGRVGDYARPLFHIALAESALGVGLGVLVCRSWPATTAFGMLAGRWPWWRRHCWSSRAGLIRDRSWRTSDRRAAGRLDVRVRGGRAGRVRVSTYGIVLASFAPGACYCSGNPWES